jgi:membrane-bound serine protease (ClpP class)
MPGRAFWLCAVGACAVLLSLARPANATSQPVVVTASVDGEINAATSSYVASAVSRADGERAAALVVTMNTPGGISTAMDDIVQALLNARVPVVVYVSPNGARADSAGLFVAQAADVVAMAPGTNIGSAHPIDASGADIGGDLRAKVVNDAVARVRSLASMHGRNADWCERAVRESVNVGVEQAVAMHVADLQAKDLPALLQAIDGRSVQRPGGGLAIEVAGAQVQDVQMSITQQFLHLLIDPNVAFLLFLVAIFGLIAEVTTPGAILPGTVGVISGILALVALTSLPVNIAGVLLMLFAFALFVVDLKAPTHGVLTAGGLVSLVLGGALLVDAGAVGTAIDPWLIVGAALAIAALFGFVLRKAVAARGRPPYDLAVGSHGNPET